MEIDVRYINTLSDGCQVKDIYLVRKVNALQTKTGRAYWSVTLQDKTGSVEAKVWEPDSPGIEEFDVMDYIFVGGEVTVFNNANQVNIRQARKAREGEYDPSDYLPCSQQDIGEMYEELMRLIGSVKAPYMKELLMYFFGDEGFKKRFCFHSAAKSVHHGFVGGLLEHTLSVAKVCSYFSKHYPFLDRDLLVTAAICHDIGKLEELTPYPANDYTDAGQLLGHIMIGANMVQDAIKGIPDFPAVKANELLHCILSHHGELEFGSPKKPAICEAMALSFADNMDAKMETLKEALYDQPGNRTAWRGFHKFLETNIRGTALES